MAWNLVDAAANAGADAVKFQTLEADAMVTQDSPKVAYQLEQTSADETQYEMLKRLELDAATHRELQAHARERGLDFISTPFSEAAADFLVDLGVDVIKVPSGEVTNLPFLRHVARQGLPLIVSTGMSKHDEVEVAVRVLREEGLEDLVLLHCLSDYPAAPSECNLRAMHTMAFAFSCPVGYSDHTQGIVVAHAAAAIGACVIEKHFTLDRSLPGPDHSASLEPPELRDMIRGIRTIESALGSGDKVCMPSEMGTRDAIRKSIVASVDIAAGAIVRQADLCMKRPGTGMSPARLDDVVGRTASRVIEAGTPLTPEMLR